MRSPILGILLVLAIASELQPCWAGEFAGRLERVDLQTVTLRGHNNQLLVVRVDRDHRQQAAPYLGMWVTVDFTTDQGTIRAKSFRCPGSH
jgi:hypothetical protein